MPKQATQNTMVRIDGATNQKIDRVRQHKPHLTKKAVIAEGVEALMVKLGLSTAPTTTPCTPTA